MIKSFVKTCIFLAIPTLIGARKVLRFLEEPSADSDFSENFARLDDAELGSVADLSICYRLR